MTRAWIIYVIFISTILAASGCWDRKELGDLTLITAITVEAGSENNYRVIAQTISPQSVAGGLGGGGITEFGKAYRNTAAEGDSIFDAANNLKKITPGIEFVNNVNVIIISEDLARTRGLAEILDYFERNSQLRKDSWLIIGRGKLEHLLDLPGRIILISSQRITDLIRLQKNSNTFAPLHLGEFIRLLESESTHPYTAVIEAKTNLTRTNEPGHGILDGNVPEPVEEITLNGTAVFRRDKLIGWLNQEESRGLQWLRGDHAGSVISFRRSGDSNNILGSEVARAKAKLEPVISNGQVYMKINIKLESYLSMIEGNINLTAAEISELEVAQGNQVKKEIEAVLRKAQEEYKVDILGFGEAVNRRYPKEWKQMKQDWPEIFPTVPVEIQVKTKIRNTATITKPMEPGK